jgi:hypothetical protein
VHRLLVGGVPWQGVVVEEVKIGKYTPKLPGMDKNGIVNRLFHTSDLNIAENAFFPQKYLIRYTFKMISEEYMNLKCCYLRRC